MSSRKHIPRHWIWKHRGFKIIAIIIAALAARLLGTLCFGALPSRTFLPAASHIPSPCLSISQAIGFMLLSVDAGGAA